jgi:hypothetical protein
MRVRRTLPVRTSLGHHSATAPQLA